MNLIEGGSLHLIMWPPVQNLQFNIVKSLNFVECIHQSIINSMIVYTYFNSQQIWLEFDNGEEMS